MNYITVASVRRTSGIASSEISDPDVESIIAEVEPQVERYYNTKFVPTEKIEIRDGNGTKRLILNKNPVLAVRDLYIDGDQEDAENVHIYKGSGKIELTADASYSTFVSGSKKIRIKYIYGYLVESSTNTTTDAASTAGSSVTLSVSSETDFSDDDWVEIYGMDGNREVAQITGTDTGELTVDELIHSHESGSKVVKLEISPIFTKLMNVLCGLALVARIVGESYDDIVGYNLAELRIQKGEPYTQWRETATQLIKEKEDLMRRINIRPCVI